MFHLTISNTAASTAASLPPSSDLHRRCAPIFITTTFIAATSMRHIRLTPAGRALRISHGCVVPNWHVYMYMYA